MVFETVKKIVHWCSEHVLAFIVLLLIIIICLLLTRCTNHFTEPFSETEYLIHEPDNKLEHHPVSNETDRMSNDRS
jgi:tellurite resistance protein TehA-like permease